MGRFYRTAKPSFVDQNTYQSPIDLMKDLIGIQEQRTDDLVAKSEVLEGSVDTIQHLNFDAENKRVKEIQTKYKDSVDSLTQKIYENPLEYNKHLPELKALQKQIVNDKTSGEWYSIEQRYNDYQQWVKDNKQIKEDNPTLYNQLNNHWYNDIVQRGAEDVEARFKGQKIIDKPDLILGYKQHFENIKASATESSNGTYKIGNKWLTEDEVANIAWNTLASDKNYRGYLNQMGNILGQQGFVNEEGNPLAAFNLVDGKGNLISFDEYQKLSDAEKKKVKRQLNPKHAFYSDLSSVSQTYSFSEQEIEEDKYGLQNNKAHLDSQLEAQKQKGRLELELLRQKGDLDKFYLKFQMQGDKDRNKYKNDLALKCANGDEGACKMIDRLTAKETLGALGNPDASLENDYELIENNVEKAPGGPIDGHAYMYATPGTVEYSALQRRKNSTKFANDKLGGTEITLNGGKTFKAEEYFNWLGDRKHTEQTAKRFLEKEKGIYQSFEFENSLAEQVANDARWTPNFIKDDAAEDWDKVYQIGNNYEDKREEWYDNYSTSSQQVSFQPIKDIEISRNMLNEIKGNKENFFLTDINGDIPKSFRDIIDEIDANSVLHVTSANAHNEMGMKINVDDEEYFIFPNQGNLAEINLMTNLSMRGVDKDSQYFKEMSDRASTRLIHDLNRTGLNSKGTKSIVTKLDGIQISLELVGDEVHLRHPDNDINSEADRVFKNMSEFTTTFYSTKR